MSDPTADAARWFDAKLGDDAVPPVVLVVGLGEGELLDVLETRAPRTRVVALEPHPQTAARFRARRDWSSWSDRLTYLVGPEYHGADQAWRAFPPRDERHVTLVHPVLERNIDASVVGALRVLKEIVYGARANAEARRRFAPRYLANTLRNLPAVLAGSDASALENVFRGLPAVVAGAGPSLDRNIAELRPLADRAVVIAADTALRPMLHAGLEPQFVAGVDPAELNAEHFERLPPHDRTWLVADPSLNARALAASAGRTFWFRVSRHEPWPWLQGLGVDVRQIDVWGSVLTAAFQTAVLLGCDPIVFIGADLSFTGGRPYARGTTFEFEWTRAVAAGAQLPELWQARIGASESDRLDAVDVRGDTVKTTQSLLAFRDWLLRHGDRCGRRVVNATGAGMFYGGSVVQSSLADVLNAPVPIPPVERIARVPPLRGTTDMAAAVDTARHDVAEPSGDGAAARWMDFCGEGYDAAAIGEALGIAARGLSSTAPGAVRPFAPKAGLVGLPEREALLRAILGRYDAPEWARSREALGARGEEAVRSAMHDVQAGLERALEREDEPFIPSGDIFGADVEQDGGVAILGRRDWWSDEWRCLLWDYFDALSIAAIAGVATGDATGAGALTATLDRIEGAVADAPRACCAADVRDVRDLVREGVLGYNLVDTTSDACIAVALRLGPQRLPEIPASQADVWARQGMLLWAPSVEEMTRRVRRYQTQIVVISMARALADVIGASGAAGRCRQLADQAAGVTRRA